MLQCSPSTIQQRGRSKLQAVKLTVNPSSTMKQINTKELQVSDAIRSSLSQAVSITSFQQKQQKICQIGNSLEDIREYMYKGEKLCLFPRLNDKTDAVRSTLHARMKSLFPEGFVYSSKVMASATNISCSSSSVSLQDVLLLIPGRPGCLFSVLKSETDQLQTIKHVVSLSKGIVTTIRRSCSVQFSLVYGTITEKELSSDETFIKALDRLVDKTSQWCVPIALTMHKEKYLKIVEAFILSISIVRCLSDSEDDPLQCLTLDQFKVIQENLLEKKVNVKVMPHCGKRVLMLEIASRLSKMAPTVIMSKDVKVREMAEKLETCVPVLSSEEFCNRKGEFTDVSIVNDGERDIPDVDGTLWTFSKLLGKQREGKRTSPRRHVQRKHSREQDFEELTATSQTKCHHNSENKIDRKRQSFPTHSMPVKRLKKEVTKTTVCANLPDQDSGKQREGKRTSPRRHVQRKHSREQDLEKLTATSQTKCHHNSENKIDRKRQSIPLHSMPVKRPKKDVTKTTVCAHLPDQNSGCVELDCDAEM